MTRVGKTFRSPSEKCGSAAQKESVTAGVQRSVAGGRTAAAVANVAWKAAKLQAEQSLNTHGPDFQQERIFTHCR